MIFFIGQFYNSAQLSSLPNLIIQTPMSRGGRRKSPTYTPVRGLRKGLVADGAVNLAPGSPERVAAEAEEKAQRGVLGWLRRALLRQK